MLLSASRFSVPSWKSQAVSRARILLESDQDCYLHAWTAYRESSLLRMLGDVKGSNEILEKFIHSTVLPGHDMGLESNARYNAQRADLIISYAQNLIRECAFSAAQKELSEWHPLNPALPSTMERISLRAGKITSGKILRYEGRFQEALSCLEDQLKDCEYDERYEGTGWRRVLLTNVADLYMELDRPKNAEELLMPELTEMVRRGQQNISSGRSLQLSLVESLIKRRIYDRAKECLGNLRNLYEAISESDALTRDGLFRVWTSLARIAHFECRWNDALLSWRKALKNVDDRGVGAQHADIVRCAIVYTLSMLGRREESLKIMNERKSNMDSQGFIFWIVGFDSYWRSHIIQEVQKLAGEEACHLKSWDSESLATNLNASLAISRENSVHSQ